MNDTPQMCSRFLVSVLLDAHPTICLHNISAMLGINSNEASLANILMIPCKSVIRLLPQFKVSAMLHIDQRVIAIITSNFRHLFFLAEAMREAKVLTSHSGCLAEGTVRFWATRTSYGRNDVAQEMWLTSFQNDVAPLFRPISSISNLND